MHPTPHPRTHHPPPPTHTCLLWQDHESEPGQHIPPEPSYCEELFEPVLEAILEALNMSKNNKDSATIIFMMGLGAGVCVCALAYSSCTPGFSLSIGLIP